MPVLLQSPPIQLSLLAAFLYAAGALIIKRSAELGVGVWRTAFVANLICALLFLPLLALGGEIHVDLWWQPVVTGACFVAGQWLTFIAFERGDVSVATPVLGIKILLVAVLVTAIGGEVGQVVGGGQMVVRVAQAAARSTANPLVAKAGHLRPRAKRVIFLFMGGGVSHLDSFDYKPALYANDGRMLEFLDQRAIAKTGAGATGRVMKPMWEFRQRGQSGRWVSELFPHMARHADDYCVVRSMHTEGVAHGPATLFLHTGATNQLRPSMGSWVTYGLGAESEKSVV